MSAHLSAAPPVQLNSVFQPPGPGSRPRSSRAAAGKEGSEVSLPRKAAQNLEQQCLSGPIRSFAPVTAPLTGEGLRLSVVAPGWVQNTPRSADRTRSGFPTRASRYAQRHTGGPPVPQRAPELFQVLRGQVRLPSQVRRATANLHAWNAGLPRPRPSRPRRQSGPDPRPTETLGR
ncbi:hypothetical protein NDU88_001119 [Pleurodeles waltl]|uniref:Uncharacterized protein n=1 Tax=Pleurodeles waltl TaxID=8319 RepID=A0AAV7Q8U2_PLEWA|nr:hypothetical protein NDU88_001119 [Pleurodeles waltl]